MYLVWSVQINITCVVRGTCKKLKSHETTHERFSLLKKKKLLDAHEISSVKKILVVDVLWLICVVLKNTENNWGRGNNHVVKTTAHRLS